ncbi:hypothetical protein H632_c2790p0, partial [Helicosporidium sp. ATCC 50920]
MSETRPNFYLPAHGGGSSFAEELEKKKSLRKKMVKGFKKVGSQVKDLMTPRGSNALSRSQGGEEAPASQGGTVEARPFAKGMARVNESAFQRPSPTASDLSAASSQAQTQSLNFAMTRAYEGVAEAASTLKSLEVSSPPAAATRIPGAPAVPVLALGRAQAAAEEPSEAPSEGEEETESDTSSPKTGPEEANVPTFAVPPPPAPERASNLGTAPVAGLNLSSLVDRVVSAAEEQAAARQLRSEEELRALETAMKDARAAEERAAPPPP